MGWVRSPGNKALPQEQLSIQDTKEGQFGGISQLGDLLRKGTEALRWW